MEMSIKFYTNVNGETSTTRDTENWEILWSYETINLFVQYSELAEDAVDLDN